MPITTTNLETVINAKVVAASSTTENKDLLLLSKSIEALDNTARLTPADIGVTVQGYNADLATETSVDGKIANIVSELVDSSPSTLNTIQEISTALGDDANHVTTMTALIGDKINTADPTFTGTLDGAGNTYTNLHPEVETTGSATGTHTIDFNTPYHNVNISGATTFSFQNSGIGKICIIQLAALAGQTPSFPSTVKWADATEPTWGDYGMWVISLTGVNASWMVGSAVGITV